jgi:hypothetical protein
MQKRLAVLDHYLAKFGKMLFRRVDGIYQIIESSLDVSSSAGEQDSQQAADTSAILESSPGRVSAHAATYGKTKHCRTLEPEPGFDAFLPRYPDLS